MAAGRKKRKKHTPSILQDKEDKRCFLCMMAGDYSVKRVQEHHVIMGTSGRAKSEELGLKVNLCEKHHIYGAEAVHNNAQNRRILEMAAQEAYERTHTRSGWMQEIGRDYLQAPSPQGEVIYHSSYRKLNMGRGITPSQKGETWEA